MTTSLAALQTSAVGLMLAALAGCISSPPTDPTPATVGAEPSLPGTQTSLVPTVAIARASGWHGGRTPQAAPGLAVNAFACGLQHPRWLHAVSGGAVLVAESDAPAPEDPQPPSLRRFAMKAVMRVAGSATPSADRITLLHDRTGRGSADARAVLATGLKSPFGMTDVGDTLYVAQADGIVRLPLAETLRRAWASTSGGQSGGFSGGQSRGESPQPATSAGYVGPAPMWVALPAGRNHHWTKALVASPDGRSLFVTVGSNSNVGENGLDEEEGRAAIWSIDIATGRKQPFATGLRNPNGMAFEPSAGALWTVVNERDELGNDLVPDYLTRVRQGDFFGWPWFYWGSHPDARAPGRADPALPAPRVPDYALGSHVAPLGLAFGAWPGQAQRRGMFIGEHGSWNRKPAVGYKVVWVEFIDGRPHGKPVDVLGGFVDDQGRAQGRPVGVAIANDGALLVADDVGGCVWRVTPAAGGPTR